MKTYDIFIKGTFVLLLFVFSHVSLSAQESKKDTSQTWSFGGVGSINFSQVSLQNWAAGGENSFSLNNFLNLHANYKKDKISWENTFDLGYGIIKQGGRDVRKTDDKLDLSSQFGYQASSKWEYSGAFNFKTQFADGYNYNDETDTKRLISDFMAPAYALLSFGMNYKPGKSFNVLISPITGKSTIVLNDSLSNAGAFGVEPGEKIRNEFGGFVKIKFTQDIMENVNMNTKLELFSNYLKEPENVDINWEMTIAMKINKFLSANVNAQLIYDDDILYVDDDGQEHGPRLQFKEVFGVGLSYKF
jgi:hypothetical protein